MHGAFIESRGPDPDVQDNSGESVHKIFKE